MKYSSKYRLTLLSVLALLSFSTIAPAVVYAAPRQVSDKDWMNANSNSWGWNYSPQTQINKDNVKDLEVKWIFPIGGKDLAPAGIQAAGIGEGTTTPPIVKDGMVYVITSFMRAYGIDAKTGKQVWSHQYVINATAIKERIPVVFSGAVHKHGFQYWERGNAIINHGLACDFYGLDGKTGKEKFWVKDICKNVPGNLGIYLARRAGAEPSIGIYEKGNQFIYVLSSAIHSNVAAVAPQDSRHVTMGIDMDTQQILWRVYGSPPQDRPDKDWALHECGIGYFRDIPCTEALAANRAGLEWDFALPGKPIGWYAGVTANWGQQIIDEDTGMLYTQTGNQGPYSNMTLAPGPRLYGSTIMAIDMNKGKLAWWLQPFPHDPYDYDANWGGILVEDPKLGKVYVYGAKEGRYFVIDAATGKPKLTVDVRKDQYARGQISAEPSKMIYEPDPRSYYDMREWNWISYPAKTVGEKGKFCTLPCTVYPFWMNGVFQTDRSYDPETNTYYLYEGALQVDILAEHSYFPNERNYKGGEMFTTRTGPVANATVVARDLTTGKVKWTWFYGYSSQRAHMVVTGSMVYSGFTDGKLRFFDKDTGKLLHELGVGSPLAIGPTIGKDSEGNSKIFVVAGPTAGLFANAQYGMGGLGTAPGTIIAVGLSDRAAAEVKTTTVTTTTATTSTVTTTQAPQTVTSTSATTVTTTAPGQTITTTSTAESIGPITYAAVGVAVIALAAAAVLVMRKK